MREARDLKVGGRGRGRRGWLFVVGGVAGEGGDEGSNGGGV